MASTVRGEATAPQLPIEIVSAPGMPSGMMIVGDRDALHLLWLQWRFEGQLRDEAALRDIRRLVVITGI